MLECHRVDRRIIEATRRRHGATVRQIVESLADDGERPVSDASVKRLLPGLLAMKMIRGEFRTPPDGRKVCRWKATLKPTPTF
jgi:hypothetical protein